MGNSKYQRSLSTKKPHATSLQRLNKKSRLNIRKEFIEKAAAINSDLKKWYSTHATSEEHKTISQNMEYLVNATGCEGNFAYDRSPMTFLT